MPHDGRQHSYSFNNFQRVLLGTAVIVVAVGLSEQTLTLKLESLLLQKKLATADTSSKTKPAILQQDESCIFKDSPIYRKVYVYPSPGHDDFRGSILSSHGNDINNTRWPWEVINERLRNETANHYSSYSMQAQFSTELLIHIIMTHPDSCLRTNNPDEASLFYVPYLPSVEFHSGFQGKPSSHATSKYAQAISDIVDRQDYQGWEREFGLTSKFWKRRNGSDHILVFSEPLQGLSHPRNKRGNYHYIHTQKQLAPPIVVSVELSTTFVNTYPACAKKNILMPYPIIDGNTFNGKLNEQADELESNLRESAPSARLSNEDEDTKRPLAQWYRAQVHGECVPLRQSMLKDFQCTQSFKLFKQARQVGHRLTYPIGMRLATFCPCPGGDTPSAKRMFDAVLAGCIPIVLSRDFVWPMSTELDGHLSPPDFAIRWNATDFTTRTSDVQCRIVNADSLQKRLESISTDQIRRLRNGLKKARELYSYYEHDTKLLPTNPLQEGILPNGGAAHTFVAALADRTKGVRWPACRDELRRLGPNLTQPGRFQC